MHATPAERPIAAALRCAAQPPKPQTRYERAAFLLRWSGFTATVVEINPLADACFVEAVAIDTRRVPCPDSAIRAAAHILRLVPIIDRDTMGPDGWVLVSLIAPADLA